MKKRIDEKKGNKLALDCKRLIVKPVSHPCVLTTRGQGGIACFAFNLVDETVVPDEDDEELDELDDKLEVDEEDEAPPLKFSTK
jgi:hypothetical protein